MKKIFKRILFSFLRPITAYYSWCGFGAYCDICDWPTGGFVGSTNRDAGKCTYKCIPCREQEIAQHK